MFEKKRIQKYIRVFPDKIPYTFQIEGYKLEIIKNQYSGKLYVIGYDKEGRVLGEGAEKMIQDFPFWWCYKKDKNGNTNPRYPKFDIVPRSVDGNDYQITKNTLGTSIILSYEVE